MLLPNNILTKQTSVFQKKRTILGSDPSHVRYNVAAARRRPPSAGGRLMAEPGGGGAEWVHAIDAFLADRGGVHKRARTADHNCRGPKSALGSYLMEEFCFGRFSATQVQTIASFAVQDGAHHPVIEKLSTLGTSGKNAGNCWRDLVRYIR
eukprot:3176024-Pyramimonas_sp.AAC.1